jgi:phospholipid/cholesterol/gamma-HCH transport system permease protein
MSQRDAATTAGGNGGPVPGALAFNRPADGTLQVRIAGTWKLGRGLPSADEVQRQLASGPPVRRVTFDAGELAGYDSALLTFLTKVITQTTAQQIETDQAGLPEGVRRLLALATAVPERKDTRAAARPPFLARVGSASVDGLRGATETLAFLGEAFVSFLKLLRGAARFRWSDLFLLIQICGAQALPIVSLISFLVGVILAYVGAVQLRMFGAQIYVADLVGIAMTRELGPIMAAIIMAGRTGAAFAAELGTMQVNEEIDAFTTLGISATDFLVLPRILALALMLPPLCVYADLLGVLGGATVAVGTLDITATEYYVRTSEAITLGDFVGGLVKAAVFGVLVAVAGCLRGIRCGRSSAAVGQATTSAVVTSIVLIIVTDSIMTVIYNILGV